MKTIVLLLLTIYCSVNNIAWSSEIVVWNADMQCIEHKSYTPSGVQSSLQRVIDTMIGKTSYINQSDEKGNPIYVPMMEFYVVYVGPKITENDIQLCSDYLKSNLEDKVFYTVSNSGWSKVKLTDSTFMQRANLNNHIFKLNTKLPDGSWYLYGIMSKRKYLITELNIDNKYINGYIKEYQNGRVIEISKYTNGVLVDTLKRFYNDSLSGYEVRSADGLRILKTVQYYSNPRAIHWYIDYELGCEVNFFEDGNIYSFVRIVNNNRIGTYLEFNEAGDVIFKREYFDN